MEVILLEKVQNLGSVGQKVNVRSGYGRNYLIPYGKAILATPANVKEMAARIAELEQTAAQSFAAAEARKERLANVTARIASKAGDEGKLFGSVGVRDIADAVTAAGVELGKHEVRLPEGPLRYVGEYDIQVQLHPDVIGSVKVQVVPEQ